jgi:hypothetical protein
LSDGVLGGVDSGDRCAATLAHDPDKHFRPKSPTTVSTRT